MFKKIMVPLDGSELAEKTLPKIINLVKQLDATLILLAVVEPGTRFINPFEAELVLTDEATYVEETERYLSKVRQTLIEFGELPAEKVRNIVTVGKPAEQIVNLTPFEEVDLLVMTTHARTGLSRLLMGSIASGVLRLVETPVVLLRPVEDKNESWVLADALIKEVTHKTAPRILVTLNGSEEAEIVIEPVATLATSLAAEVYLLRVEVPSVPIEYVNQVGDYGTYYGNEVADENPQRNQEIISYLKKIQATFLAKGITCVATVEAGQAPDQIIDYASEIKANFIAMATHARGRIGQLLLGSVAESVMARSHLPVLLVHSTAPDKTPKDNAPIDIHPATV